MNLQLPLDDGLTYLYYLLNDKELEYIVNHQYKLFSVRFFTKQFFCPLLDIKYARRIASERSNWINGVERVHIMRFLVDGKNLLPYIKGELDNKRAQIVVVKNQLQQFNQHIVGYIERLETINLPNATNQFI